MKKLVVSFVFLLPCFFLARGDSPEKEQYKIAEKFFKHYEFKKALPYYLEMLESYPDDKLIYYKAGICYFHADQPEDAIKMLLKARDLDKESEFFDIAYYLGSAFHLNYQFDKAIEEYRKYQILLKKYMISDEELNETERQISISKMAAKMVSSPVNVQIEKLHPPVNTSFGEYGCVVAENGRKLFFSSTRNCGTGGLDPFTGNYNEDIYIALSTDKGTWKVENPGPPLNTPVNELPLSFDENSNTLYFYRATPDNVSHIYYSQFIGNLWTEPMQLDMNINAYSHQTGACLSPDGQRFYFSSNRAGGYGGMDLYYCQKQENGTWGAPINLGETINTSFDEEGPFIRDSLLYFASNGHSTIGGFDLFVSVISDKFSNPENLGFPINSTYDEIYFTVTTDGKTGFYGRKASDSFGNEDIFKITFNPDNPEKEKPQLSESGNSIVKELAVEEPGKSDEPINSPVVSSIQKIENTTTTSDKKSRSECLSVKVHFCYNVGNCITEYSRRKLDEVFAVLKEQSDLRLELRGYTDPTGSENYNLKLSVERAETVKNYLVAKGISPSRLTVKGFGSRDCIPVSSVRANVINRRVEFWVLQ